MKPCLSLCGIVGPAQEMECALGPLGVTTFSLEIGRALLRLLTVAAGTRRLSSCTPFVFIWERLENCSGPVPPLPSSLAPDEQSSRPVKWQMLGRENPGLCSHSFPT